MHGLQLQKSILHIEHKSYHNIISQVCFLTFRASSDTSVLQHMQILCASQCAEAVNQQASLLGRRPEIHMWQSCKFPVVTSASTELERDVEHEEAWLADAKGTLDVSTCSTSPIMESHLAWTPGSPEHSMCSHLILGGNAWSLGDPGTNPSPAGSISDQLALLQTDIPHELLEDEPCLVLRYPRQRSQQRSLCKQACHSVKCPMLPWVCSPNQRPRGPFAMQCCVISCVVER